MSFTLRMLGCTSILGVLLLASSLAGAQPAPAEPVPAEPAPEADSEPQAEPEAEPAGTDEELPEPPPLDPEPTDELPALPAPEIKAKATAEPPAEKSDWVFNFGGSYRLSAGAVSEMRVDADGRLFNQQNLVRHRLRFAPSMAYKKILRVDTDIQLATGILSKDPPGQRFEGIGFPRGELGRAWGDGVEYSDQFNVRRLYLTWITPIGAVLVGRMTSSWGEGILANNGDREFQDWGEPTFGRDYNYGDVVNRLLFATRPLAALGDAPWTQRWTIAIGGDVVQRDDRIELENGDRAIQAIGAMYFEDGPKRLGMYVVRRGERTRNEDSLDVWVVDVAGKWKWELTPDVDLHASGELAMIRGDTTIPRTGCRPLGKFDVRQLGYAAQGGVLFKRLGIGGDVQLGYASGDSNPCDGNLRNFNFDPDYNPSLILFDQLRAAETLASAANAADPSRVGVAPDAIEELPSNGAVSNAIYVRPTLRYSFKDFAARFAVLYARAEEDVVDPYAFNAESRVANFQGGDGSARNLGVELNLGVDYKFKWESYLEVFASVQAGRFFPGPAFRDASGNRPDDINMILGRLVISWLPPQTAEVPGSATN